MVELTVEVTEQFYDTMKKAKDDVEKKLGYTMDYGEYIETCMNDLVYVIAQYEAEKKKTSMDTPPKHMGSYYHG